MSPSPSSEALRGSLELVVLKTLALAPMHGWGICQRVQELSEGLLELNQGSLYPALQRLEAKGWIASAWETTENNRKAKYYRLTPAGRAALGEETASWREFVGAIEMILRTT